MLEMFSLKGKVALLTGASRGLGKPMAIGLAKAGAHVVLVARDETELISVREEIVRQGARPRCFRWTWPRDRDPGRDVQSGPRARAH